ncbi:MAG TPA: sulfatase-like hydrolase/transferase [Bdellovibrionales bacterium]|nr:sulfatase-like hydrolase/transferase [Bdellovibrionales bacterium]
MSSSAAPRPNILFIYTDQQRADSIGAVSPWMRTPNLDRLAREGTVFTNCFSVSPTCVPARFGLLAGAYPQELGVWENGAHTFDSRWPNWVRALRDSGYRTSLIGTSHLRPIVAGSHFGENGDFLRSIGFTDAEEVGGPRASRTTESVMTEAWREAGVLDAFRADLSDRYETDPLAVRPSPLGYELHYDRFVGRQARAAIESYGRAEPWFLWVGFAGPHEPWDTPPPFAASYAAGSVPAAKPRFDYLPSSEPLVRRIRQSARLGAGDLDKVKSLRADYAGAASLIDAEVGALIASLDGRGLLENTIIIFNSDHGEMNGDFGLIYKETFFNEAVRVPLVVRDPRARSVGHVDAPVESLDVGATILELAGVRAACGRAESLVPLLRGPGPRRKRSALSQFARESMIVEGGWKLAANEDGEPYMLFNLESDPEELRNLVRDPAFRSKRVELSEVLRRRIDEAGA